MIEVKVGFFGFLQIERPQSRQRVKLGLGSRVDDLLEELGLDEKDVLRTCVMVNEKRCDLSSRLHHGDKVELILFAAGG